MFNLGLAMYKPSSLQRFGRTFVSFTEMFLDNRSLQKTATSTTYSETDCSLIFRLTATLYIKKT